jgi:1,4-alpha-glucan branching enzyme
MKRCSNDRLLTLTDDPYLDPYREQLKERREHAAHSFARLTDGAGDLLDIAAGHEHFGLHRTEDGWVFREWAPAATGISLVGTFSDWNETADLKLQPVNDHGHWELHLPADRLKPGQLYHLRVHWKDGAGDRIPAFARHVVQDPKTSIMNAVVPDPQPFAWQHPTPLPPSAPLIYESHVGMAQESAGVGSYADFRDHILPRIRDAGYNTVQLMAIMEHPYYASFGYQVSSFFAASSRFGTPSDLKSLVDSAHGMGLRVIMDLVHSHAVSNEVEGLSRFDGTLYQYFHDGPRGRHDAWDSRCFNYGKPEVLHFLLSNCRFWLDEYRFDGFRFDGVTSMLYHHHGLSHAFTSYENYFDDSVDREAITYLTLANDLIHTLRPDAITIAEDVSGMPGLAAPIDDGGCGFDYRLAMGVPDCWFKLINDTRDEDWSMEYLWHELTNRRSDEQSIGYVESHDQALVGGKTLMFEMADADMYHTMGKDQSNLRVERAMALHKMARLATLGAAGHGYLTFMGNEFGHPEWVDFPREGNANSYHYARRQWSLRDNPDLKYHFLADFDRALLNLAGTYCPLAHAPHAFQVDSEGKLLIFGRGPLLFCFNFHPTVSTSDHAVTVPAGTYTHLLDTDEAQFGGQGRIQADTVYPTRDYQDGNERHHALQIYLPCRTAMMLQRRFEPSP